MSQLPIPGPICERATRSTSKLPLLAAALQTLCVPSTPFLETRHCFYCVIKFSDRLGGLGEVTFGLRKCGKVSYPHFPACKSCKDVISFAYEEKDIPRKDFLGQVNEAMQNRLAMAGSLHRVCRPDFWIICCHVEYFSSLHNTNTANYSGVEYFGHFTAPPLRGPCRLLWMLFPSIFSPT